MNIEKIKEFIELAKSEGVSELKYEGKDLKISVSFASSAPSYAPSIQYTPSVSSPSSAPAKQAEGNFHTINSPFVGTYYHSAAPGKPAFAKRGDKIQPGQVLCILEAMKIMNEIESDVAGEIVEICVENESLVEFGQVLFKIKT